MIKKLVRRYPNLEAELVRAGLTKKDLAPILGCTRSTLSLKLNGKSPLTLLEAIKIKQFIGVDMPLEELFAETANLGQSVDQAVS